MTKNRDEAAEERAELPADKWLKDNYMKLQQLDPVDTFKAGWDAAIEHYKISKLASTMDEHFSKTPLERVITYGKDTSGNISDPHGIGINGNKIAKGKVEVTNNLTGRYKTS